MIPIYPERPLSTRKQQGGGASFSARQIQPLLLSSVWLKWLSMFVALREKKWLLKQTKQPQ